MLEVIDDLCSETIIRRLRN